MKVIIIIIVILCSIQLASELRISRQNRSIAELVNEI